MKIVHTSDWHVDATRWGIRNPETGVNTALESNKRCIEALVDRAIEEEVDAVIVSGDTFDNGRPSAESIAYIRDQFRRMSDAGVAVVAEDGNHGRHGVGLTDRGPSELLSGKNVHIYNDISVFEVNTRSGILHVLGNPWPERARLLQEAGATDLVDPDEINTMLSGYVASRLADVVDDLDGKPDFLVATSHITVTDTALVRGSETVINTRSIFEEVMLPIGIFDDIDVDYAALGHIHHAQQFERGAYAGTLNRLTFGEANDVKGAFFVDLKSGERKFFETPARSMVNIRLDKEEDVNLEAIERLTPVKVHLAKGERQIPDLLRKRIKDAGGIIVSTKPSPPEVTSRDRVVIKRGEDPMEQLRIWAQDVQSINNETFKRLKAKAQHIHEGCSH